MEIHIADLDREWVDRSLVLDTETWGRIIGFLRAKSLLAEHTLDRIAAPTETITIPREQARLIGKQVLVTILEGPVWREQPPSVPDYIVPIAASNGVWVDPALGPRQSWMGRQKRIMTHLFHFANFCDTCQGFTVGKES